jgi:hypothetical protein
MALQVIHGIQLVKVSKRGKSRNGCKNNVTKCVTVSKNGTMALEISGAVCGYDYKHNHHESLATMMKTGNDNDQFARRFIARIWRYCRLFVLHKGQFDTEKIWNLLNKIIR